MDAMTMGDTSRAGGRDAAGRRQATTRTTQVGYGVCHRAGSRSGVTLMELAVVMAVLATLAAITLPMLGAGHARVSVLRTAQRFATAVRYAQATAQDGDCRMRVVLDEAAFRVERAGDEGWVRDLRATTGVVSGGSNYPGDGVEFSRDGRPLVPGTATPRAGTFTFTCGGATRSVVLQLTGRVRVR